MLETSVSAPEALTAVGMRGSGLTVLSKAERKQLIERVTEHLRFDIIDLLQQHYVSQCSRLGKELLHLWAFAMASICTGCIEPLSRSQSRWT